MPFVTEYTPTEALFELAKKAGAGQGLATGYQLAQQQQRIEQERITSASNAFLRQLAMKQSAQIQAQQLRQQQIEANQRFALGNANLQLDKQRLDQTFDIQAAIREQQQRTEMTPTQQYEQKLGLLEAQNKYQEEARSREAEDRAKLEKQKSDERLKLKEIEWAGKISRENKETANKGMIADIQDQISDIEEKYKEAGRQRVKLGQKLVDDWTKGDEDQYNRWDDIYKKAEAELKIKKAALSTLRRGEDIGTAEFQKATGLVTGGVQSGNIPKPLPTNPSQLVAGQVYKTPNGQTVRYIGNGQVEVLD